MELRTMVYIGAGIALLAAAGYAVKLHSDAIRDVKKVAFGYGQAATQSLWDKEKIIQSAAALEDARAKALETKRRLERQKENQDEQDRELAVAKLAADRLAASVNKLQLAANSLAASAGCTGIGDSAIKCLRQAVASLGDVLGRSSEEYRRMAVAADEARNRGLKCERDYDALTPQTSLKLTMALSL